MKKQILAFILSITFFIPNSAFSMTDELEARTPISSPLQQHTSASSWVEDLEQQQSNPVTHKISAVYNLDPRNWSSNTKILVGGITFFAVFYTCYSIIQIVNGAFYMPFSRFMECK